ncbi:nonribosomal peptide synthetase 12 [Vararia minispora EC-137]|uniref:Nonribosomal peptide synthetase 12 n=1 Tax=Vararia minispora EC-137 TaxID=1314806 RepID=A0ACB8QFN6_9AGAM|nr:nonribosomal peptide synthetase 12 [Vararia minispora EC-137]
MVAPQLALSSLSPPDQQFFVQFGFGEATQCPFACVHHAFEHSADLNPDAVAVEHLNDLITYAELERSANILAARLRSLGVDRGSRVCLLVQRSIAMVVGIVAILKAGAAYVPLDASIVTDSTLGHVLSDSQSILVLTLEEFRHRIPSRTLICLDDCVIRDPTHTNTRLRDHSIASDSVYVIYTSGTTGKPKGVEVKHGSVTNLVCLAPGNLGMRLGKRVSQLLNIAFDMAAWEILGALCNGATLCIRGKTSREWRALMKTVDIVIATPSMMVPHQPTDYMNIEAVAVAGEPVPQGLADAWAANTKFFTSCGPTEITIVNTLRLHLSGTKVSIGRPTPNNNVYILDESMRPVPVGEPGIMWAGGAGISKGYVNLPDKTGERYKNDIFANDGSLMFNTGDLGRWQSDGTLEHLGRVDDQVKVKGFRVELDGVAAAMQTCPQVIHSAALLIDSQLWGFVTPSSADRDAVLAAASRIQPYYAVPTRLLVLEDFPYTGNGKVDKRALRGLALSQAQKEQIPVPDREEVSPAALIPAAQPSPLKIGAVTIAKLPPSYEGYLAKTLSSSATCVTNPSSGSSSCSTPSLATTPSLSVLEKNATPWTGYENEILPEKIQGHYARNLRHQIFTLYRRLFGVVFVTNMSIFIVVLVHGTFQSNQLGLLVISNLFCAILMRQDYVINAFFRVFCSVPSSWPLSIRRICARVYHIGGLHSGCAISGVLWLILFAAQATRELASGGPASVLTVAVTYWILLLLLMIVGFAYPRFRQIQHNRFEASHRFFGWTATAFVWQIISLINDYRLPGQSLGNALIHASPFWLVSVLTVSIILPWVRLRKVPVRAVILSKHAVRIYFDYVTPVPGSFTRISDNPLMEWHGFATVPEPGKAGYSLVVSRAGDWTSKQIDNPPTHLWVRGIPTCGVLRIVPLFRRLVFVATGSGIGPCAPCILQQRVPIRLLWTSPNVRQTFGDELVDALLEKSPGAVVYDTRTHGKPDMVRLTYRLVREFNAEAVCVISNQKLTRKVVYGMMSRGIPAFGAIWDS